EAQMNDLLSRLRSLETDNAQLKQQLSDQYMEAIALKRAQLEAAKHRPVPPAVPTPTDSARMNSNRPVTADAEASIDPAALGRAELLDALIARIKAGGDDPRIQALAVAAISVARPGQAMDPALLDGLGPKAREQVARFHQMVAVAYDELAGDPRATLDRRAMIARLDEVFGAQPLRIETLELCRRVDSYGVYEPFGSTRFLAGRNNRVLVYVELENFKHHPLQDGQHEVRLEQQVELYDATGETTVWRQGPVQLVDVSRNKRRDFFIVYPIDLPARLTAGSYRLKVRIADKHTGSICEQTLHDLQIVADQSLVNGR
ncbi:MAG: hypothetical protein ACPGYV_04745, partial [Phycisphaeraceae bacterium]